MPDKIIYSDLDGTLLDEGNYSHTEAEPALNRIARSNIPLVLCTSKTRAEIEVHRTRLNLRHPFISENGGGIYIPKGYFSFPVVGAESGDEQLIRLGTPYAEIREHFVRLREQLHANVRGFADMSIEEVASLTGLGRDEAALARQREFDEAFVFDGEPDRNFLRAIEECGLSWTQGRIFHIMGKHDKGRAVDLLTALYRRQFGDITSIGLGDSLNDLPMLKAVDTPVLVMHRDGGFDTRITIPNLLKTRLPGPAGWSEALLDLLKEEPNRNAETPPDQVLLIDIFNAALKAVDPYNAVLNAVRVVQDRLQLAGASYDLAAFDRIVVVGAGKATARMALALEFLLGRRISAGLIVVKDGHTEPLQFIEQVEAAHPVPNEAGIAGTQRILSLVRDADEKTLVICLLSGGASALLVAPVDDLTLQDKQETTRLLLNAGASINELNAVRKHLSRVKGGRLAREIFPAQLITLVVSDVIGDPLDVIASGPTSPDNSTFADAWSAIAKFSLQDRLPPRVADYLQRGINGKVEETVKAEDVCLKQVRNITVAGIRQALFAAEEKSRQLGFSSKTISDTLQGEASDAARYLAQAAREELVGMQSGERHCLLCGGETTVTVHGSGKGGRNQEFALAFSLEIDGLQGVSLLSAGTDGTDGPTDAAGAIVDGNTIALARKLELNPLHYLRNNDSYSFFDRLDTLSGVSSHFKTGPTGTNVMDLQIVLLKSNVVPSIHNGSHSPLTC